MKPDGCAEMRLLVQADVDGELAAADAARVAAHLEGCQSCTELQAQLLALSGRLRRDAPYYAASDALRAMVRERSRAVAEPEIHEAVPAAGPRPHMWQHLGRLRPALRPVVPFGAGLALAACLALVVLLPGGGGLPDTVVAGHIRALQPGHLMDVASTDQHTVKPWFDGRLDYAPPVKDLKAVGFPLAGGRLDYLDGRPVAALVYQRRQHFIDLFVWPDGGHFDRGPTGGERSGYHFLRWSQDGMTFWAVSDVTRDDLAEFVRQWRAS
jgi:anti-sigma factor RsiW